jgi:nicotinamide mononucleotide adenylyltransferase
MFIGRWCPLHRGHTAIIEAKLKKAKLPLLLLVRDTSFDEIKAMDRAELLRIWMGYNNYDGTIMIIEIEEMVVGENIQAISGTEIREKLKSEDESWREMVAKGTSDFIELIYRKMMK